MVSGGESYSKPLSCFADICICIFPCLCLGIGITTNFACIGLIVIDLKCRLKSFVEQSNFFVRQLAYEIGQHGFREAYQSITVNTAVMFQPLIDPDRNLCGEFLVRSVYGSADNR